MHLSDDRSFDASDVYLVLESLSLRVVDDLLDVSVLEVLGLFNPRLYAMHDGRDCYSTSYMYIYGRTIVWRA